MSTINLHGTAGRFATVTAEPQNGKVSMALLDESAHLSIGVHLRPQDAMALAQALLAAAQAAMVERSVHGQ